MTQSVLSERRGRLGLITLDRPKALNALNEEMCGEILRVLDAWQDDDAVEVVLMQGSGGRAFCAGGDVVGMHKAGKAGSADWENFFRTEYRMNHRIGTYAKPYIAVMDGITMGGGVGISIHGDYRIATENTLFAMPETGIGLIPDVGGTHALPRLPGEIGTFLGLTGARLKAEDCLYTGIASHYVGAESISGLIGALASGVDPVADVIDQFAAAPDQPPTLEPQRADIDRHFAHDRCEDILRSLEEGGDWGAEQRKILGRMSPLSMKLTLRALREGAADDLAACLKREYRIVCNIKSGHDFYEGVRAQLIDKDRSPKWEAARLEDVSDEQVERYFMTPPHGDLSLSR